MGAPDNYLLKGGPLPSYMKDTGMFDTISIVSFSSRHFSGESGLVSVHLSKLLSNQSANKKTTISHCFNEVFLLPLSDSSKL